MPTKARISTEKKKKLRKQTKAKLEQFCLDNPGVVTEKTTTQNGLWQQIFFYFYGEFPVDAGSEFPTRPNQWGLKVSQPPPGSSDPRWNDLLIQCEAIKLLREVITEAASCEVEESSSEV